MCSEQLRLNAPRFGQTLLSLIAFEQIRGALPPFILHGAPRFGQTLLSLIGLFEQIRGYTDPSHSLSGRLLEFVIIMSLI